MVSKLVKSVYYNNLPKDQVYTKIPFKKFNQTISGEKFFASLSKI